MQNQRKTCKNLMLLMMLLMNYEPLGVEDEERFLQHTFRQVRVADTRLMKLRAAPELSNICWPFVRPLLLLGVADAVLAGTAGPPGRASAVPAAAALALVPAAVPVPAVALAVFLLAAPRRLPLAAALVPVSLAAPPVLPAPPPAPCRYHPSILGRSPRNRCFRRASHHLADAVEKLAANLISEHARKERSKQGR